MSFDLLKDPSCVIDKFALLADRKLPLINRKQAPQPLNLILKQADEHDYSKHPIAQYVALFVLLMT